MNVLETRGLRKIYQTPSGEVRALDGVSKLRTVHTDHRSHVEFQTYFSSTNMQTLWS